MVKKLQVFISSTFTDLQDERQAAVESVLNAGHIPAGMELFKAGDESQKHTIKRWIDESDVYMVILGGRYGSIDESTGKSYTHWEYDYAGEVEIPRFAIVIDDDALEGKIKEFGSEVMERENPQKLADFKAEVLSKTSKFFSDIKDIKLTVLESLKEYERNTTLTGWISGKKIGNYEDLLEENRELLKENNKLKRESERLEDKLNKENEIDGFSYEEIEKYLHETSIEIPKSLRGNSSEVKSISILKAFVLFADDLSIGIMNRRGMNDNNRFAFFYLAPELMIFNLVEKVKVAGQEYQRVQLSKTGLKFLSMYKMKQFQKETNK